MDTTTSEVPPPPPPAASSEDKTVAILSYLTIIGFIVAIVMHGNKKTKLGAYHLRQVLGIIVTGFCLGIIAIIPIFGWLVAIIGSILLLIAWIVGLISAASGKLTPAPVLGQYFQKWFKTTFE